MVGLYGIKLLDEERFSEIRDLVEAMLPEETRQKSRRFTFSAGIQRKILGDLLVRSLLCEKYLLNLSQIHIDNTHHGKPYLSGHDDIHFNLSHSGDWIVVAFSDFPVGIDVEKIRQVNFDIAKRFFSAIEIDQLFSLPEQEQTDHFFEVWTLKESYLKALGTGLTRPLSSFTVSFLDNTPILVLNVQVTDIKLKNINFEQGYKLSVCSFGADISDTIKKLNIDDLLQMIQK